MTAHNEKADNNRLYLHVCRENAQEAIFLNDEDYQVFIKFLKDYFSNPNNLEGTQKNFTIRGSTFRGTPHLPQNFFNQIELLAYKLEPNRFDLLIKQIVPETFAKFIRAISTRYAIYFNKKYHRAGNLFKDPYQSSIIKDLSSLLYLTRDLHVNFSKKGAVPAHYYSSYPEYLGQRESEWIKSQDILSLEGVSNYKSFVESGTSEKSTKSKDTSPPKLQPGIPEIILAIVILIIFSSYSVRNIKSSTLPAPEIYTLTPQSYAEVLGEKENAPENENTKPDDVEEKIIVVVNIKDDSESVNIRSSSSTSSEKIGQAKQGDSFEFISENSEWYQIKLKDGSTGYISAKYSELRKDN